MTNAERKTHVIRIAGTNRAGDVLADIWADVERIDIMEIMTQVLPSPAGAVVQHQKVTIKLRWLDDPDGNDYDPDGDRNREHKIVKVCDPKLPQAKLDDPDEWIPIRSIVRMEVKHAGGAILKHFKESVANSDIDSRVVANRRITHWDTTIDAAARKAFDDDPTRKVFVVADGNGSYSRIENSEDRDQYVEHQIVKKLNRQDSQQLLSTGNDQRRVLHLRNQYQIDESREAKLEELGTGDINPPYRLDAFQNIINISWGVGAAFVIGDNSGYIWRCKIRGPSTELPVQFDQVAQIGPKSGTFDPGNCLCGSYAKIDGQSIFVLGGFNAKSGGLGPGDIPIKIDDGVILISRDGESWTRVKTFAGRSNGHYSAAPFYMIWDPVAARFYCEVHTIDFDIGDGVETTESWSSSDGHAWTRGEVVAGNVFTATWEAHTKYKHTNPVWDGAGLADSYFGIDKSKKNSTESFPLGHLVEDGLLITFDDMPFGQQFVGFAGRIWGRIDEFSSALEVSFNSGVTWSTATSNIHVINDDQDPAALRIPTLIVAPLKEIPTTP